MVERFTFGGYIVTKTPECRMTRVARMSNGKIGQVEPAAGGFEHTNNRFEHTNTGAALAPTA